MKNPSFVETFLRRRSVLAGLAVGVGLALGGGLASAQPAPGAGAGRDPALVGSWFGERIENRVGMHRWKAERRGDGRYEVNRVLIKGTLEQNAAGELGYPPPVETREVGTWSSRGGVVFLAPHSAAAYAYRYTSLADGCVQLDQADPSTGEVARRAMSLGECKPATSRGLAAVLKVECDISEPELRMSQMLDLRIEQDADGQRYASYDGKRDPTPVEVRDYAVRKSFDPGRVDSASSAGEMVLLQIKQRAAAGSALAGKLGFDPAAVRVARMYLLIPPRPHRPMDNMGGSRSVLIEAFDGQDARLGAVLVSLPVIAACKPRP